MARYKDAVDWIASNDDSDLGDPVDGTFIVSICMTADLFGKEDHEVYCDVVKRRRLNERREQRFQEGEEAEEARMLGAP